MGFRQKLTSAIARVAKFARLDEDISLGRARASFSHQRVELWVGPNEGATYLHNDPAVEASRLACDGLYRPAYLDDDGNTVEGRRWVTGPSGIPGASDKRPDPRDVVTLWEGESLNVKTTAGIDFLFSQGYNSSAAAQTNGLAWVALSNDSLTETSGSTTLSNEITTNGLGRAKGTYAHTGGASTATNTLTFTATGTQACQKAALFSAVSSGTMNHALSFTQRTLQNLDTLTTTFTITLS